MEETLFELFGSYAELVLSLMGVCAALTAFLPAPQEGSSVLYRVVYKVLNVLAANVGKAKNVAETRKA